MTHLGTGVHLSNKKFATNMPSSESDARTTKLPLANMSNCPTEPRSSAGGGKHGRRGRLRRTNLGTRAMRVPVAVEAVEEENRFKSENVGLATTFTRSNASEYAAKASSDGSKPTLFPASSVGRAGAPDKENLGNDRGDGKSDGVYTSGFRNVIKQQIAAEAGTDATADSVEARYKKSALKSANASEKQIASQATSIRFNKRKPFSVAFVSQEEVIDKRGSSVRRERSKRRLMGRSVFDNGSARQPCRKHSLETVVVNESADETSVSAACLRDFIQQRRSLLKNENNERMEPTPVSSPLGGGVFMDLSSAVAPVTSPDKKGMDKLNIAPKTPKSGVVGKSTQDHKSCPVVSLGHFSESLWIDFGDETQNRVGKPRTLSFLLQAPPSNNPDDYYLVEVEHVPYKKGFNLEVEGKTTVQTVETPNSSSVSEQELPGISESTKMINTNMRTPCTVDDKRVQNQSTVLCVRSGDTKRMNLTWTPTDIGGVREVVYLKLPRGRIRITAHGKARGIAGTSKGKPSTSEKGIRNSSKLLTRRDEPSKKSLLTSHIKKMRKSTASTPRVIPANVGRTPVSKQFVTPKRNSVAKRRVESSAWTSRSAISNFDTSSKIYSKVSPGGTVTSAFEMKAQTIFDDKWADKQCDAFAKWLNYTFRPSEDAAHELFLQESFDQKSMDRVALRTLLLHRRRAQARIKASELYNNTGMKTVRQVIEAEVVTGRLAIRSDRDIFVDVGLQSQLFSLLFSYSTPWLRLGLETVLGVVIATNLPTEHKHSKGVGASGTRNRKISRSKAVLRQFIVDRVISDPRIVMKYTKGRCKIPSGKFEMKYKDELRKHTLLTLLLLVTFLDRAKMENVLKNVPRLFSKQAIVKSSRDVLVTICRDYLLAEGNIVKHLSHIGVAVYHTQSPMDEFDYTVKNLAIDLRDGVRLSRMIEILAHDGDASLLSQLRVPAVSRLQKLHNVSIALGAIEQAGVMSVSDVAAHHVVDGHRPIVLKILWSVIAHFQLSKLLDENLLLQEIGNVRRANRFRRNSTFAISYCSATCFSIDEAAYSGTEGRLVKLLLQWCQAVCSCYEFEVENFTTSFADGKALCLLVNYYHPGILKLSEISPTTRDFGFEAIDVDDLMEESSSVGFKNALENERRNSALASKIMFEIGGIPSMLPTFDTFDRPEEKSTVLCIAYLCSRLMESSSEILATITIQIFYRRYQRRVLMVRKKKAARVIWRSWERNKEAYLLARRRKYSRAVRVIEVFAHAWREQLKKFRDERIQKEKEKESARLLQSTFRMFLVRASFQEKISQFRSAVIIQRLYRNYSQRLFHQRTRVAVFLLQAFFRGCYARHAFVSKQAAATIIQSVWRKFRAEFQYSCNVLSVVCVQSLARRKLSVIEVRKRYSAILTIQCAARGWLVTLRRLAMENEDYSRRLVAAATYCQCLVRRNAALVHLNLQRSERLSARAIRNCYLAYKQRLRYKCTRKAIIAIQGAFRGYRARLDIQNWHFAATSIQTLWRKFSEKLRYSNTLRLIILSQSCARRLIARRFKSQRLSAVAAIQRSMRCWSARKHRNCLYHEDELRRRIYCAAVVCQSMVRRNQAIAKFRSKLLGYRSARVIQSSYRRHTQHRMYCKKKKAVLMIQSLRRGNAARKKVWLQQAAATIVQSEWRRFSAELNYMQSLINIIMVQSFIKRYLAIQEVVKRKSSLIKIQCAARRFLSRMRVNALREEEKEYSLRLHRFATLCQSLFRQKAAKKAHSSLALQYRSAVRIQSCYRAHQQTQLHKVARNSAMTIHSLFRGHLARTEQEIRRKSVIRIQAEWRRFWAEFRYSLLHLSTVQVQGVLRRKFAIRSAAKRRSAVLTIQCAARVLLARKIWRSVYYAKEKYLRDLNSAAILCQSLARRNLARAQFCSLRLILRSAILIQSHYRKYSAIVRYQSRRRASIHIQTIYRGYAARNEITSREGAAIKIQAAWRRLSAEVQYTYKLMYIILIQCWGRMIIAQMQRVQRETAVRTIQCAARCSLALKRKLEQEQLFSIRLDKAAVFCQSMVRMKRAHSRYHSQIRKSFSARVIQRWHRMNFQRKVFRLQRSLAMKLQSLYRGRLARLRICKQITAASKIQTVWRRFSAEEKYFSNLVDIILVQSYVRRFIALKLSSTRKQAVLRIQCAMRQMLAMKSLAALRKAHALAFISTVVFSQALYRRKAAIGVYRAKRKQFDSARLIQSRWRSFVCQSKVVALRSAAVLIQSHVRMNTSMRMLKKLRCQRKVQAVVRIQAWARMAVLKRAYIEHLAAINIQKIWRGYTTNVDFILSILSILQIQAFARQMVQKKRYFLMVRGFVRLQAVVRGYLERGNAEKSILCVVYLQSWWRCTCARKRFNSNRRSAILIQGAARGMMARSLLDIQHFAALEIQRIWRGYQVNVNYMIALLSVIKLQSHFRRIAACEVVICMRINAFSQSVELRHKISSRRIQAVFRSFRHRKNLIKVVVTAQRVVRGFLARRHALNKIKVIVLLQSRFRGQRIRMFNSKRVRQAAKKIERANKLALAAPHLRLGVRTSAALCVLQTSTRLAEIIKAIITLEVSTRYSKECCVAFASADAAKVLYALVRTCNRSLPHIELLYHILQTLKNVAKFPCLVASIAKPDSVDILMDLIQMFRDKDDIFLCALSLLERIVFSNIEFLALCGNRENTKRLNGIHALCMRKLASSRHGRIQTSNSFISLAATDPARKGIYILESILSSAKETKIKT